MTHITRERYRLILISHDDVIKCKHFPRYWPFVRGIHRSPVNSPHKGQWRGALMFFLSALEWTINNLEVDNLGRHCVHYDVTVVKFRCPFSKYTLYLPALPGSSPISSPGHVTRNHDDMMMSSHGKSFRFTTRYIFFVVSSSDVIVMYYKKRENLCWATLTAIVVDDLVLYHIEHHGLFYHDYYCPFPWK